MTTYNNEWVTSSRLGEGGPLSKLSALLRTSARALEAADLPGKAASGVAAAEALQRALMTLNTPSRALGVVFSVAVSDLIQAFGTDTAYLLAHTNLRSILTAYGVAPYLRPSEEIKLAPGPFPSQFYTSPATATRGALDRLGASTLRGVPDPPPAAFAFWENDVINAFYDQGDAQRPVHGPGQDLGALLVTVQGTDPTTVLRDFALLQTLFSRLTVPDLSQLSFDASFSPLTAPLLLPFSSPISRLAPYIQSDFYSRPPDFLRLRAGDLLPWMNDYLLDLGEISRITSAKAGSVASLEDLAAALAQQVSNYTQMLSQLQDTLARVVEVLTTMSASRLFIPLQSMGTQGLTNIIRAASATRSDPERVIVPSNSSWLENEIIPHKDAEAQRAIDSGFVSTPSETLLVAGVVLVFRPGYLYDLFESIFTPTQADKDENDGTIPSVQDDPAVIEDRNLEAPADLPDPSPAPLPTPRTSPAPSPTPQPAPRSPSDAPPYGWTQDDLRYAPTPTVTASLASSTTRASSHRCAYDPDAQVFVLQPPGAPRHHTVVTPSDVELRLPISAPPSAPIQVTSAQELTPPQWHRGTTLTEGKGLVHATHEHRAEVFPAVSTDIPAQNLPACEWFPPLPMRTYVRTACTVTILPGGGRISSPQMDTYFDTRGYSVPTTPFQLTGERFFLDVQVTWARNNTPVWVRTEVTALVEQDGQRYALVYPYLPARPVVTADVVTGTLFPLDTQPFLRTLTLTSELEQYSGLTLETVATARFYDPSARPSIGMQFGLQAVVDGTIVASDSVPLAPVDYVTLLSQQSAYGASRIRFDYAGPADMGPGEALFPLIPVQGYSVQQRQDPVLPGEAPIGELDPTAPEVGARLLQRHLTTSGYAKKQFAGRLSRRSRGGAGLPNIRDWQVLTAHVPELISIGLGTVGTPADIIPVQASLVPAQWDSVLSFDSGTGLWDATPWQDAISFAGASSGYVSPLPAYAAANAGRPWLLRVRLSSTSTVQGHFIPDVEVDAARSEGWHEANDTYSTCLYTMDPNVVTARTGLHSSGTVGGFPSLAHASSEVLQVDLPLLRQQSRSEWRTARRLSVTFGAFAPVGDHKPLGETWLLDTRSGVLALVQQEDGLYVEWSEYVLGEPTRQVVLEVKAPELVWEVGSFYTVDLTVAPSTRQYALTWRYWGPDLSSTPSTLLNELVTIPAGTPVRALSGYPLPGGTLRFGCAPRLEGETVRSTRVLRAGSTQVRQTWVGGPPLGVREVQCRIL